MPQGACNSPAIHQRRINQALHDLIGVDCYPYVDDILIFGADTEEEHLAKVKRVLDQLVKDGLLANPLKSKLIAREVEVLGHRLSAKGLMADPLKVVKVLEWGTPKDAKDIRKFMGLVNYLKKFTPQLAPHAQQLTRLTRKNSAWLWTKQQQDAFDSIKEICQNIQPLGSIDYSDHAPPIWVITNASKTGIGGILAQGKN